MSVEHLYQFLDSFEYENDVVTIAQVRRELEKKHPQDERIIDLIKDGKDAAEDAAYRKGLERAIEIVSTDKSCKCYYKCEVYAVNAIRKELKGDR